MRPDGLLAALAADASRGQPFLPPCGWLVAATLPRAFNRMLKKDFDPALWRKPFPV